MSEKDDLQLVQGFLLEHSAMNKEHNVWNLWLGTKYPGVTQH